LQFIVTHQELDWKTFEEAKEDEEAKEAAQLK
jgi:hypothetical protein